MQQGRCHGWKNGKPLVTEEVKNGQFSDDFPGYYAMFTN